MKNRKIEKFLQLAAVWSSAHVLIYFLQPDKETENARKVAVMMSYIERSTPEQYWFGHSGHQKLGKSEKVSVSLYDDLISESDS